MKLSLCGGSCLILIKIPFTLKTGPYRVHTMNFQKKESIELNWMKGLGSNFNIYLKKFNPNVWMRKYESCSDAAISKSKPTIKT